MVEFAETRHDHDAAVNYRQDTQPAEASTISTFDSLARCYLRSCQNITALVIQVEGRTSWIIYRRA
jgi:hypothetical protein